MTIALFAYASKNKLRFETDRGLATVEALWDMPLLDKSGWDLNTVANTVNNQLTAASGTSFVNAANPATEILEAKLEVVKYVIAYKIAERDALAKAAENKAMRSKLLSILGEKQDEALKALTPEEIQAKLKELG